MKREIFDMDIGGFPLQLPSSDGRNRRCTAIHQSRSKYNPGEAALIASEVDRLIDNGVRPSDIGVITPYNAQIKVLDDELKNAGIEDTGSIDINTIDSFQGSEKEVIRLC